MKKNIIISLLVAVMLLIIPTHVKAYDNGEILLVSAESSSNKITIYGDAGNDVTAGTVVVLNETGTTVIDIETFEINEDHSFFYTLNNTFKAGTYKIRVADYNGGAFIDTTVKVVDAPTPDPGKKDESCEKVIGPTWHWNNKKGICEETGVVNTYTR